MARLGRSYTRRPKLVRAPDPYLLREGWSLTDGVAWPLDWTQSGPMVTDVQSGAGRIVTGTTANASTMFRNTVALASVDTNGLVRVKFTNITNGGFYYFIHIRGSSTMTGTPIALASSYELRLSWYNPTSAIGVNFYEIDGSGAKTYRNGADHLGGTIAAGDWVWLRWEVSGNPTSVFKYRIWKDGDAEPGTWTNDWSSSVVANYQGAYVGLVVQNGDTTSEDLAFDDLGILAAVASNDVTGTSAQTLAAFTSTASGSTVTGTSANTLSAFTSTASGSTVTGTSAQTLAAFTPTASGTHSITGTSAQTLAAFTSTASGSTVTGSSANTLAAFTSTASGTHSISGTSATTLGAFTSSATGSYGADVTGTAAVALDAFTPSAAGSTVTGTSAQTLAAFTSTASGSSVTGTSATTMAAFTSTASGTHSISGTSAQTLAAFTSTATGSVGADPTGTVAATLDPFTSTATGGVGATGTSATTLDAFTSTASGSSTTGTVAVTLGVFISTGTGTHTGTSATFTITAVPVRVELTDNERRRQGITGRPLRMRHNEAPYSILKTSGTYTQVRHPTPAQIAAADIFYQGGRVYDVDSTEASALAAAGYSSMLTYT